MRARGRRGAAHGGGAERHLRPRRGGGAPCDSSPGERRLVRRALPMVKRRQSRRAPLDRTGVVGEHGSGGLQQASCSGGIWRARPDRAQWRAAPSFFSFGFLILIMAVVLELLFFIFSFIQKFCSTDLFLKFCSFFSSKTLFPNFFPLSQFLLLILF